MCGSQCEVRSRVCGSGTAAGRIGGRAGSCAGRLPGADFWRERGRPQGGAILEFGPERVRGFAGKAALLRRLRVEADVRDSVVLLVSTTGSDAFTRRFTGQLRKLLRGAGDRRGAQRAAPLPCDAAASQSPAGGAVRGIGGGVAPVSLYGCLRGMSRPPGVRLDSACGRPTAATGPSKAAAARGRSVPVGTGRPQVRPRAAGDRCPLLSLVGAALQMVQKRPPPRSAEGKRDPATASAAARPHAGEALSDPGFGEK